jgi:hypothetical protein
MLVRGGIVPDRAQENRRMANRFVGMLIFCTVDQHFASEDASHQEETYGH